MNDVKMNLEAKSKRHFEKVRRLRKMIKNLEVTRDSEEMGTPEYYQVVQDIQKLELQAERNLGQARAYEKSAEMIK